MTQPVQNSAASTPSPQSALAVMTQPQFLLVLPLIGTLAVYAYEAGYLLAYGVPRSVVELTVTHVAAFSFLNSLVVGTALFFLLAPHKSGFTSKFATALTAITIVFHDDLSWPQIFACSLGAGLLVTATPLLRTLTFKGLLGNIDAWLSTRWPVWSDNPNARAAVLLIGFTTLNCTMCYAYGYFDARYLPNWVMVTEKDEQLTVVRRYGDTLVMRRHDGHGYYSGPVYLQKIDSQPSGFTLQRAIEPTLVAPKPDVPEEPHGRPQDGAMPANQLDAPRNEDVPAQK